MFIHYAVGMLLSLTLPVSDEILQNLYVPQFEPFVLPPGPEDADHIWVVSVWIMDANYSAAVVQLRAKIGLQSHFNCAQDKSDVKK